ncbi:hypothetical protein [Staphylococcus caprae]
MRFDLNNENGKKSEEIIITDFIVRTGVGHSVVKFEGGKIVNFSNATPIIFAHYIKYKLQKENVNVEVNNYMNSTVINFKYHATDSSDFNYIEVFNKIMNELLESKIDDDSYKLALESAKNDMKYNFKINEYRATMKFMEMYSDYYNFKLQNLIKNIWKFNKNDLEVFKREMIFYENCAININKDIKNKEKLLRFPKINERFTYLMNKEIGVDIEINEEARCYNKFEGYLFSNFSNNDLHLNYTNLLILGCHIFHSDFQIHASKKEIGIIGKRIYNENNIQKDFKVKDKDFYDYKNIILNSIKSLYATNDDFYEVLAKLNGANIELSKVINYLKELKKEELIHLVNDSTVNIYRIEFEEA